MDVSLFCIFAAISIIATIVFLKVDSESNKIPLVMIFNLFLAFFLFVSSMDITYNIDYVNETSTYTDYYQNTTTTNYTLHTTTNHYPFDMTVFLFFFMIIIIDILVLFERISRFVGFKQKNKYDLFINNK